MAAAVAGGGIVVCNSSHKLRLPSLKKAKMASDLAFVTSQFGGIKISCTHLQLPNPIPSAPLTLPLRPVARNFSFSLSSSFFCLVNVKIDEKKWKGNPFFVSLVCQILKILRSKILSFSFFHTFCWQPSAVLMRIWVYLFVGFVWTLNFGKNERNDQKEKSLRNGCLFKC